MFVLNLIDFYILRQKFMRGFDMEYTVNFLYDDEAEVWIATSEEIAGLVLESESYDRLIEKVKLAVPELLELNGQPAASKLNVTSDKRQLVYT